MALKPQQKLGLAVMVLALLAIGLTTLLPSPQQIQTSSDTSVWCLLCGALGVVDVTLNILLFLPLGSGLGLFGMRRARALGIIVLTSLTVEVLQLGLIPGRDASLSDLLTNTAGGVLGYWLGPKLMRLLRPDPRLGYRLAVGTMILWVLQQAFAGWALQRRLPASVYYGQWAPALGQFDQFTGSVWSVTLNGLPLGNGRLSASRMVRAELSRPSFEINVQARSGELTQRTAPIFSIFDDQQREILLVGARQNDLVFHLRTRLAGLHLRSPSIALPDVLPASADSLIAIKVQLDGTRYRIQLGTTGRVVSRLVPSSASWGWSFLLPFSYDFGFEAWWLTGLWLGGFWLLVGYWAAQSQSGVFIWWSFMALTMIIGLAVVPSLMGLVVGAISEWGAAVLGAAIGWGLGTVVGRTGRLDRPLRP